MANRRMFSKSITNSARFLKMPIDSQNLYFHLGLHADDDGVVEAYSVMKMLGNTEDNLKVLAAKSFVKILNEDLVSYIMDWNENNLIRPDRKIDSVYKDLLLKMLPEADFVNPRPRADTGKTTGQPMDVQRTTNGRHRLGEVSIGKDSINSTASGDGDIPEIIKLFEEVNPTIQRMYGNTSQRAAVKRMLKIFGREKLEEMIKSLKKINAQKYWPKSTTPCQLENNIPIYKAKADELKGEKNKLVFI